MDDLEAHKNKRTRAKASLTRVQNWTEQNKTSANSVYLLKTKEEQLKTAFEDYSKAQDFIEDICPDNEDRGDIEDKYHQTLAIIWELIHKLAPTINVSTPSAPSFASPMSIQLPKINIKTFTGKMDEWTPFYQLFKALIADNVNLTGAQKFMYLKGCLAAEPSKLVENLAVTDDNFRIALSLLQKRYENKIATVNAHFIALFEGPSINKCNATTLRDFVTNANKNLEALKNLKYSHKQLWEFLSIYLLSKKLDFGSRKAFESERKVDELPTLPEFIEFFEKRCTVLENLASTDTPPQRKPVKASTFHTSVVSQVPQNPSCLYCNDAYHRIYTCYKFKNLSVAERKQFVKENRLCSNCLGSKHSLTQCKTKGCALCSQRHHTLLHLNYSPKNTHSHESRPNQHNTQKVSRSIPETSSSSQNPQSNGNSQTQTSLNMSAHSTQNCHVLLATACVKLYTSEGNQIIARALLDSGSQNSFITDELVKTLGYAPYYNPLSISGITQFSTSCNNMVNVTLYSNVLPHKHFEISCAILPKITCKLPQVPLDPKGLNIPSDIALADPNFFDPSDIDMLIGADLYPHLLTQGIFNLGNHLPVLQNTYLGWILSGNVQNICTRLNARSVHFCHCSVTHSIKPNTVSLFVQSQAEQTPIDQLLSNFWNLEQIPNKLPLSHEDKCAEEIFKQTTKILENGVFQVNLPLKTPSEASNLGDSLSVAKRRFFSLEKKFIKHPEYFKEYKGFIDEYISLNHGKFIPLNPINPHSQPKCFLPHHAVIREQATSTKVRVVFDGSCKTSSGVSLNDILFKGFQVQPDLYDILTRFRAFKYVLTSDIEKMFRQVIVNPDQRFLQNILWRDSPQEPLQCIELNTVTFGLNCSPYLATRVLKEIALTNIDSFPLAANALLYQCYVDDILCGCDNVDELKELFIELNSLLNAHGFTLHKWCSNSEQFLENISAEKTKEYDFKVDETPNKVLGLKWNPISDVLFISVPQTLPVGEITKRKILSVISRCFDPLGLISLVIVVGKLLMQSLWRLKIDWDTPISNEAILQEWRNFVVNLPRLRDLKIPRYLCKNKTIVSTQVHGFCDASTKAYAACVYLRAVYDDRSVSCNLISSKSRVAPIKTVTLPRLELCAMVLLSKLVTQLLSIIGDKFSIDSTNLWSDSQIALCWIKSPAARWSVFVGHRVALIQDLTWRCEWRHIKSQDNPADLPSRGVLPQNAINCKLWFNGPAFLHAQKVEFSEFENYNTEIELPEERKANSCLNLTKHDFWNNLFHKFSSFSKLNRTLAYLLRFIYNCRNSKSQNTGILSVNELQEARFLIVRKLQQQYFPKEITELKSNKTLTNKGLLSLKPFFQEENQLIRVGGRLENADIPYDQKHPILLPSNNYVVSLMLKYEHLRLAHAGAQTVLSNIRLRYWPLNGLRQIKKVIRNCLICHRFKAQPAQQIMADIPRDRVQITRPFQKVGVDYGGPFFLRSSSLRKSSLIKCYIAVFVCFVTKCVHIELVSSLSTEAYLMTLKRFISRRGNPTLIYSDNATNFLGASNQLKELRDFFKTKRHSDAIQEFLSNSEIEFKFIPPRSPHWGGLWESAIKGAKYHIKRLIGNAHITFEQFSTILVQIEAILNSRPLCPLSNDPNDLRCITPGHFLIGSALTTYPEKDLSHLPDNRLSFYQLLSKIQQTFWKRWSVEYLNRLQHRPKWLHSSANLNVGEIVLLKEDDSPVMCWPLGRILEIKVAADGKVRLVKVKTQKGEYFRSITKICPLPQDDGAFANR